MSAAKEIFLGAIEITSPAERNDYLTDRSAGDESLRGRVRALLSAHDRDDRLLDRAAAEHLAADAVAEVPPPPEKEPLDFLDPSSKPESLGRLGHYEILEEIGRGGMGIVLRAFDDKLHRIVAIKALAPGMAATAAARQRFVREARAAAAVSHENVIAIHSVEESGTVSYLVMQYIAGNTLQRKLETAGTLELKQILRIGLQIAEGLAAAHRQGLIHRDIKPANILLENGVERVKITDFGLARAADDASLTQSGIISGTPLYMSPEQAGSEAVDHRTDLFSLGSVLYALGTGHPPFRARTMMAVMKRVCEETPRPMRETNPDIPAWLDAIVLKLLAKKPSERYGTANEVAAVLGARLADLQSGTLSAGTGRSPVRVGRWAAAALAIAAVALVAWFAPTRWFTAPPTEKRESVKPASTGPVVLQPSRTLLWHAEDAIALAFSPDGKLLASGGHDRTILLWDTETWKPRALDHPGNVSNLVFIPNSTRLASVSRARDVAAVRIWDVPTGREVRTLGEPEGGIWGLDASPDGKLLAWGGFDRKLTICDLTKEAEPLVVQNVVPRLVRALSFSGDGKRIATGGSGPTRLWDATTGLEVPSELNLLEDMCPAFLPRRDELAGWTFSAGRLTLCGMPSGRARAEWRAHPQSINGIAVSADGRFIASVGQEGIARIWSVADQSEIATLIGPTTGLLAAAFTPDGKQLAASSTDNHRISLWDLPPVCHAGKSTPHGRE